LVSVVLPTFPGPPHRGRRSPDRALEGNAPHIRQIERTCDKGDLFCRPRQRQALLHWAYDSRTI
jgi:hypothetical protein